jgi:rod shape-determining protein MreC
MGSYTVSPEESRGRRDVAVAAAFFVLALVGFYLPPAAQDQVAGAVRASALRPFLATQEALADARLRAEDALRLQAQLDSLTFLVVSQATLAEENQRLRGLLDLRERFPGVFVPANAIRPGTAGTESMFLLDVGSGDGVAVGDPVLMRNGRIGLVGRIRAVRGSTAVGVDWSHPDFRVSAMTADGKVFGIVEPRRGEFREAHRLLLNGIPYYEHLDSGTVVTTSGLGGGIPRGIPIGEVLDLAEEERSWRRAYWLRPVVETGSVTHVLVAVDAPSLEGMGDSLWGEGAVLPDTVGGGDAGAHGVSGAASGRDILAPASNGAGGIP